MANLDAPFGLSPIGKIGGGTDPAMNSYTAFANYATAISQGDVVKKGQVLCIIEAMKIMNEIESEFDGTIMKVNVSNGDPVEYNQPLFVIKPS